MAPASRPRWQLPPGVTPGLQDYASAAHIADDYDEYFAFNSLFEFDEQIIANHFRPDRLIADLGCGTGRALVPLVRRGLRGLAVDLSSDMLRVVRDKADDEDLPIECLRANMVQLDCLAPESVDDAICMFSTLGMIRGRQNRQQALDHVHRIIRPGGKFILHVHNYWYNLYDPAGPWWLLGNLLRSIFVRDIERGDKFFPYRGIPNMFLHVFTRSELTAALRRAGFVVCEVHSLDPERHRDLRRPWLFSRLRANGWIVVCQKQ